MTYLENEEHSHNLKNSEIQASYDEKDSEFYSSLIAAVNERSPLWDHRLPISARYEPIKQKLWNEIYVMLNG